MPPFDQNIARSDAEALIPEDFFMEIQKAIPAQSAVLTLARQLPSGTAKQKRLPVMSSLPQAYFVDGEAPDGGMKPTTAAQWKNKFVDYEEIAVIVPIPIAVLDDSGFPIWEEVRPYIVEAAGAKIDGAVLFGEDAPASYPGAVVESAIAAGKSVALGTGADLYDDLLAEDGVFAAVEEDGWEVTGQVAHPRFRGKLRGLRDQNKQPIFKRAQPDGQNVQQRTVYDVDGVPLTFLRNGAFDESEAHLIAGAFDQLVHSFRRDATFDVLREAVITNADGNVILNLPQQNMVALRMFMRWGWQLPNPVTRLNPTEGGKVGAGGSDQVGRYPFAVLTPTPS